MFIVDKIVDNKLLCESIDDTNNEKIVIERFDNAKEGDVIKIVDNKFIIDYEFTEKRKSNIKNKLSRLKRKN